MYGIFKKFKVRSNYSLIAYFLFFFENKCHTFFEMIGIFLEGLYEFLYFFNTAFFYG